VSPSHNFRLFVLFVPKMVKLVKNLTKLRQNNFACFLRHGVSRLLSSSVKAATTRRTSWKLYR